MPYQRDRELPKGVKSSLPKEARVIFRKAFNSAAEANPDYDDGRLSQIAWGAVKNAGWSKDKDGNWSQESKKVLTHLAYRDSLVAMLPGNYVKEI